VANYALNSVTDKRVVVLVGVPIGRVLEPLTDALSALRAVDSSAFQGVTVFLYTAGAQNIAATDWASIDSFSGT
jgi:hypothetical protein